MQTKHTGAMRPQFTMIPGGVKVEWLDVDTGNAVWTETLTLKPGCSVASQIQGEGFFRPVPGYFTDPQGKRHFVMLAETGCVMADSDN